LFLKDSKTKNYLGEIEPSEVVTLELGDCPAVEALAFAVIELRKYGRQIDMPRRRRKLIRHPISWLTPIINKDLFHKDERGYYIATVIFLYPFSLPVVWEGGIWHKIWDRILQMS